VIQSISWLDVRHSGAPFRDFGSGRDWRDATVLGHCGGQSTPGSTSAPALFKRAAPPSAEGKS